MGKKSLKKLTLNRETMRNLSDGDLSQLGGAGTGTCAGSGCPDICGDLSRSCHTEYCQVPVQPTNPIHTLLHHSDIWLCTILT